MGPKRSHIDTLGPSTENGLHVELEGFTPRDNGRSMSGDNIVPSRVGQDVEVLVDDGVEDDAGKIVR